MTRKFKIAIAVLVVLYALVGIAFGYVLTDKDNNVTEAETLTNTEMQKIYTPMVAMPELIIVEVEKEPVVEETVVHQEAKEPEWGFDFDYVCRVVAAESRGESYEGQVAVAQCIWNTALSRGLTPVEVVDIPNRYTDPVNEDLVTESVVDACRNAFLGTDTVTEEKIEYFYSTAGGFYSEWHENSLEHVITIGNHKFFKEK